MYTEFLKPILDVNVWGGKIRKDGQKQEEELLVVEFGIWSV